MTGSDTTQKVLALDVGEKRVGVAIGVGDVGIAHPLKTLERNAETIQAIIDIMTDEEVESLVIGVPRGLDGQDTEQTRKTLAFIEEMEAVTLLPIIMQDEAVTSIEAEEILKTQGKPYSKAMIDAMAASIILQDYFDTIKSGQA